MRKLIWPAALALLLAACGQEDLGPREAAEQFFQRIAAGEMKEAYDSTAFVFQSEQSQKGFESAAKELGLGKLATITVGAPETTGNTAKVPAEVRTPDGKKSPLVLTLQRESGAWRLYSLKSPRSVETGLSENRFTLAGRTTGLQEASNLPIPDEVARREMTQEAMAKFSEAILQKSFSDFYDYVAHSWQKDLTRSQLQEAFQAFIDRGVDLSVLATLEPQFDAPPQVSADGILTYTGHYDTKPVIVSFALKFIYELPAELLRKPERAPLEGARDWRLFGIDVNLRK